LNLLFGDTVPESFGSDETASLLIKILNELRALQKLTFKPLLHSTGSDGNKQDSNVEYKVIGTKIKKLTVNFSAISEYGTSGLEVFNITFSFVLQSCPQVESLNLMVYHNYQARSTSTTLNLCLLAHKCLKSIAIGVNGCSSYRYIFDRIPDKQRKLLLKLCQLKSGFSIGAQGQSLSKHLRMVGKLMLDTLKGFGKNKPYVI
jgi:hypothetical protein